MLKKLQANLHDFVSPFIEVGVGDALQRNNRWVIRDKCSFSYLLALVLDVTGKEFGEVGYGFG